MESEFQLRGRVPRHGLAMALFVFLTAGDAGRCESVCAYRAESGAIVYTNTPDKKGVCAGVTNARPLPSASATDVGRFDRTVKMFAEQYGVSAHLVHAVIATESAYNPSAVSTKGARGLMQLMPATARRYGVTSLFDPVENIRAGVAHLRDLLDRFGGDTRLAVAAYNAGAGAVDRYSGVPPFRETRQYVTRVMRRLGGRPAGRTQPTQEVRKLSKVEVQVSPNGHVSLVN